MKCIFLVFCLWIPINLTKAQPGDLTNDLPFFQQQSQVYQKWLDHSGLGISLKVTDLDVEPKKLYLYLAFPYSNADSIVNAWRDLKTSFERERPLTLEQQLLYKMTHVMEVRQSMAEVHIYDTYDLRREPRFYRIIRFEQDKITVEESNPQDKTRHLQLHPPDYSEMKKMSEEHFQSIYAREAIFDRVFDFANNYFGQMVYEDIRPKVDLLEREETLRFEVLDLRREVLTDEANPTLCRILRSFGYDCNWVKREMLTFTITHEEHPDGFKLSIVIDGKYGSGLYSHVRRGGYIDMETDFDEYLERYADKFREKLRRYLK